MVLISDCTWGRHQASSLDCSGFLKFPQFINSCWVVSDETPDVMQNAVKPEVSAGASESLVAFHSWCPHFGRGIANWDCRAGTAGIAG